MNMYGLPAIQKYAVGGTILVNPDGTASYRQPSGAITQSVGGPNAVAALKAAYPTAMVAETIPLTLPTRDLTPPRTISLANPPVDVASIPSSAATSSGYSDTTSSGFSTPQTNAKELLDRVYTDVLGRKPTQIGYDFYLPKIISGELNANNIVSAVTGGATSGGDQQAAIDFALQTNLREFDNRVASGDFTGAKSILDQSINQYYLDPTASYANIAEYLNKDPKFANIRAANEGQLFDVDDIRDFGSAVDAPDTTTRPLTAVEQLYRDILGRDADPEGLIANTRRFGDTIEDEERKAFILGAVKSGEITQAQADELLGITSDAAGAGAPTAAKPEDMLNRLLYQPILGRTGDPGGLAAYKDLFLGKGDTMISPQERAQFIRGAVENNELTQRAADAYLGTLPTQQQFLPQGAMNLGRIDPYFLRTAAPRIASDPLTGQPQLQGATSLIQGGATPVAPAAPFAKGGDVEYAGSRALTPAELGSTFERTYGEGSFIDPRTGKPVEGLLLPAPERDVVFGEELRRKEAELMAGMTPEERARMQLQMAIRQGRTGIDPMGAGIAAIPRVYRSMDPDDLGPAESRAPRYYSYAEGGLADAAQNLAARGRYGDSTLVHMAPEELSGLRALARAQGNDLTINPRTGLPEAFSLKKLFRAASFVLPFIPIPGLFGMSSLLTRSILSGVAAGASAKGKFDFKQALGGGLRAYAMGSLGEKLGGGPATPGGPTTPPTTVPEAAAVNPMAAPTVTTPSGDISLASSYTGAGATPVGPQSLSADLTAPLKVGSGYTDVAAAPIFEAPIGPAGGADIPVTGGTLPPGADTVPGRMSSVITPEGQGFGQPLTKGTEIAMAGLGGLSIEEGAKEARNYELAAAAAKQKEEEEKRRFDELFRRTLGQVRTVKQGGLMKLAGGGVTYMEGGGATGPAGEPRVVRGTGDGMSDSVPATIEGVQEARLANDEFVIPADVVADIGNGSSDAGAKKLYGMMDRIRKARHGTTKQPPEINAEAMMPA